jgi:hypothetical protein
VTPGAGVDSLDAPLVDVAVLVYKRTRYIRVAVESVLAQTTDRWRATVWANGVGGPSVRDEIESLLDDPRLSYYATEAEFPLAVNWTAAINHGTAPYVALLHDDDLWHPEFLARRLEALEAHPECGFAFSECERIDAEGRVFHRVPASLSQGVITREVMADRLRGQDIVVPSTLVVRRAAYAAVGAAFDGTYRYCDWEMVARLAAGFPTYYLPVHDNATRTHETRGTSVDSSDPDELLAMTDHLDATFAGSVPGYDRFRGRARARNRAAVLLRSAHDSHVSGGWPASGRLYLRALREYPPIVFRSASLVIAGERLFGKRLLDHVRSLRRSVVRRGSRPEHS